MDEKSYADLVAIFQFLPGPASSQVGIGIGVMRGGIMGGITAFSGFTMPSVIALIVFALLLQGLNIGDAGWIHGLKIVRVAVVAHAILGMAQKLTPDLQRKSIALAALTIALLWPTVFTQVGVILLAGVFGFLLYKEDTPDKSVSFSFPVSRRLGTFCLALFFGLLIALPILREITSVFYLFPFLLL